MWDPLSKSERCTKRKWKQVKDERQRLSDRNSEKGPGQAPAPRVLCCGEPTLCAQFAARRAACDSQPPPLTNQGRKENASFLTQKSGDGRRGSQLKLSRVTFFSLYSFVYFTPIETRHVCNSSDKLYYFIRTGLFHALKLLFCFCCSSPRSSN